MDLPFVRPRGNYQGAPFLEGGTKRRFLRHGLGFGIDTLKSDLGVFSPGRDQAPAQHHQLTCCRIRLNPYRGHCVSGIEAILTRV